MAAGGALMVIFVVLAALDASGLSPSSICLRRCANLAAISDIRSMGGAVVLDLRGVPAPPFPLVVGGTSVGAEVGPPAKLPGSGGGGGGGGGGGAGAPVDGAPPVDMSRFKGGAGGILLFLLIELSP